MKRVLLQPAYVLHRRSYRETSFLIELFTQNYGRFTVIARGARKNKSSAQGLLQPFIPLLVSWSGKGELMTLTQVEAHGEIKYLSGDCLFAGFYLNELLMSLLQKWDAHENLYLIYERTLYNLQKNILEQKILRSFEKYLLEELGYGLLPKSSTLKPSTFLPDKFYRFVPEEGFVLSDRDDHTNLQANIFSGKSLLAIAQENWDDETCLRDAKRLTRFLLAPLLGARPLHSRRLFTQPLDHIDEEK